MAETQGRIVVSQSHLSNISMSNYLTLLTILYRQIKDLGFSMIITRIRVPCVCSGDYSLPICGFKEIVGVTWPLEFDPFAIIGHAKELGQKVYIKPCTEFGPFINDGVPTSVNGKAEEPNCRLSIRTLNRRRISVIVATKKIKRGEYLSFYYSPEYWRMMLHLYKLKPETEEAIRWALSREELKCWPNYDQEVSEEEDA